MLSKEEIESHIDLVKLPQYKANSTEKALVEYIDQLESDKQKLIEKLEKRRKQNNDRYGRAIDTDEFPEMYEYSGQVEEDDYLLSIVKGVENG